MFQFTVLFTSVEHVAAEEEGKAEGALADTEDGEGSGAEEAHGAHHVLAADGALGQLLGAGGAGGDVPALQEHALQGRRHADLAALFERKVVHLCNVTQRLLEAAHSQLERANPRLRRRH